MFNIDKIQLGISACLLGEKVRFDGGHKNSAYCKKVLSEHVSYVPVCPEMAIGMGAPRKSIRLVRDGQQILVQSADGSLDVTNALNEFSEKKVNQLDFIDGYILCAKSPTCGMERVTEYKMGTNQGARTGIGAYARVLMERYSLLPVEEEGRLHDLPLRENFFTRVYAYHDWKALVHEGLTKHKLQQFHARYKYMLMAHNPQQYRKLGPMLADFSPGIEVVAEQYFKQFMEILKIIATRKNHTNVLQHLQGYFKNHLSAPQKASLLEAILKYNQGIQPLLVPITLINHYLAEFPTPYIENQVYLNPHPEALKLRYAY